MTSPLSRLPFLLFSVAYACLAHSAPVAGLAPYERPADAPRLAVAPPANPALALFGVAEPPPPSLNFIKDQGRWYTPFALPGMPPPYDLRGWHVRPAPSAK